MEPMGSYYRMKTFGDYHHIVMLCPNDFVQGTVCGIHLLDGIGPGFLEFIEIGFLLDRFQNVPLPVQTPFIVFVRGVRTPVSEWAKYFPSSNFVASESGR